MTNIIRLNRDIERYVFHKTYPFSTSEVLSFYVSDKPEYMPESALLLTDLGKAGYHLVLQKDTREWLFSLWRRDTDLVCATHGNTIEEALYDAMAIAVHQAKETKNV